MSLEEEAIMLAKAVIKLEDRGFIQTYEEEEELDCEHLRRIAIHHARNIRDHARRVAENKDKP